MLRTALEVSRVVLVSGIGFVHFLCSWYTSDIVGKSLVEYMCLNICSTVHFAKISISEKMYRLAM